jgi:hypothetical protein
MGVRGQRHDPAALYPRERTPGTHCTWGWVGLRAGLDTEIRGKNSCLCRGSNLDRPVRSQTLYWLSYCQITGYLCSASPAVISQNEEYDENVEAGNISFSASGTSAHLSQPKCMQEKNITVSAYFWPTCCVLLSHHGIYECAFYCFH